MNVDAVLIACSKSKSIVPPFCTMAETLYTGQLYKAQLAYARQVLKASDLVIFIMSAEHCLLRLSDVIPSYEKTLADLPVETRMLWGETIVEQLCQKLPSLWVSPHWMHQSIHPDYSSRARVCVLAGKLYKAPLKRPFARLQVEIVDPVPAGLGYGQQVSWLNEQVEQHGI